MLRYIASQCIKFMLWAFIVLQEAGRRAFWSVNGPRIVQIGYEDEEDPKVMEAYEQLGSLVNTCFISVHESPLNLYLLNIWLIICMHIIESMFWSVGSQQQCGGTIQSDHKVVILYYHQLTLQYLSIRTLIIMKVIPSQFSILRLELPILEICKLCGSE